MKRALILLVLLAGCSNPPAQPAAEEMVDMEAEVQCDRAFGVQYLKWHGYHQGGISVRLDRDGRPVPCPEWGE